MSAPFGDDPTHRWVHGHRTPSGADLWFADDLVAKVHPARTDAVALAARLTAAGTLPAFVPPARPGVLQASDGRAVTIWPRVEVVDPEAADLPWPEAATLLAGLHRTPPPDGLPGHGWPARLARATARAPDDLRALGERLITEVSHRTEPRRLLHGDWHLGQLGRWQGAWRLLDIDDLGVGDPAWDLARPAGFWAAGLLGDDDWAGFVDAYRQAAGPGVPSETDPWPALDLPARCAVFVAAVAAPNADESDSSHTAEALLAACHRMAQ